jgi:hypothetical protein
MKIKTYILSFLVSVFVFATLADVSKVLITYSIYYYEYNQEKEACLNEKPDMFQSDKLFLKALMKRVNDICPNSKPKPPKVESSNLVLFVQNLSFNPNDIVSLKLNNCFGYKFNYKFLNLDDFFHPPILVS